MSRLAFARAGRAWVVGVTGAPGSGKSSLVNALVGLARARGERVALVAVDPSSPLTGGAVLGDRVRLQAHALDPGVYVRSMASRGRLGGVARATLGAVRVLDAAGWPLIFVEAVGAGQVEVDVAAAVDTTAVVVTPGWGDALQVAKAGLMEVADVFVVNKADRPGAEQTVADLEASVHLGPDDGWRPPVLTTIATEGTGADELWEALDEHRAYLAAAGRRQARRRLRLAGEVRRLALDRAEHEVALRCQAPEFESLVDRVAAGHDDPESAAEQLLGPQT